MGDSRRHAHLAGGSRALADALIAGAAQAIGATIVTRKRPDFERQGIPVVSY